MRLLDQSENRLREVPYCTEDDNRGNNILRGVIPKPIYEATPQFPAPGASICAHCGKSIVDVQDIMLSHRISQFAPDL